GVYFGPGSARNQPLRVTGPQTNNRGELLGILYALSIVQPFKAVGIDTNSEYSIRSMVYLAVENAQKGWRCANADLLQDIVAWIHCRSAPVMLHHVAGHSGSAHNDMADTLAKEGA
ncbi:ribonuclease H-like domain-containing protein, partial [Mycena vulgaris]